MCCARTSSSSAHDTVSSSDRKRYMTTTMVMMVVVVAAVVVVESSTWWRWNHIEHTGDWLHPGRELLPSREGADVGTCGGARRVDDLLKRGPNVSGGVTYRSVGWPRPDRGDASPDNTCSAAHDDGCLQHWRLATAAWGDNGRSSSARGVGLHSWEGKCHRCFNLIEQTSKVDYPRDSELWWRFLQLWRRSALLPPPRAVAGFFTSGDLRQLYYNSDKHPAFYIQSGRLLSSILKRSSDLVFFKTTIS